MSFEDGSQTGPAARSLGVSSGEFRAVQRDTQTFEAVPALVVGAGRADPPTAPQPNLHYVFDDPNDGEPGRDRMSVHLLWELILAVGIVGAGFVLVDAKPGALDGDALRKLAILATVYGLLALASALSLRAAVPNLAVGGVAFASAVWIGQHADGSWTATTTTTIGLCAALGLIQGLFVVGLHVPAWATSLGVLLALMGWATTQQALTPDVGYDSTPDAFLWLVGFVSVSIVASVITTAGAVRRGFGRYRSVADPAKRRTRLAEVIAVSATALSSVVAGLAGALWITTADPAPDVSSAGREMAIVFTAAGLGAALLGGVSVYGRRGGIFGTALATCLVVLTLEWVGAAHPMWSKEIVLAIVVGIGLGVTRLVERYGRPVLIPADDEETWMPRAGSPASASSAWRSGPTPAGGLWSDEGWGGGAR